jgi:hypothetical protein
MRHIACTAQSEGGRMKRYLDPIALLEEKHQEAAAVLAAGTAATDGADRARLFRHAADLLAMHAVLEERHLYPVVAAHRGRLAPEAAADHAAIRHLAAKILSQGPDEIDTDLVRQLSALLERHVKGERGAFYPGVRALFREDQLDVLGQQMMATLSELEDSDARFELLSEGKDACL